MIKFCSNLILLTLNVPKTFHLIYTLHQVYYVTLKYENHVVVNNTGGQQNFHNQLCSKLQKRF